MPLNLEEEAEPARGQRERLSPASLAVRMEGWGPDQGRSEPPGNRGKWMVP